MERQLDLVLIGGGPAGVAAAITAANAGLKVSMVFPRKPVARPMEQALQSVHPGLESLLAYLGAEKAVHYASRGQYQGIMSDGRWTPLSTVQDETWTGHHISREAFDQYLQFCASRQGVGILDDEVVKISPDALYLRSGRQLVSSYVIDASGRNRFAAKQFGLAETFHSPMLTTWSGVACGIPDLVRPTLQTTFTPESFGWTWLAPHNSGDCTWTRLSRTREMPLCVPEQLAAAEHHSPVSSANVRWRCYDELTQGRTLLAGEAASLIDPGAGQGILRACWTGIMAARTVIDILQYTRPAALAMQEYEDWYRDQFRQQSAQLRSYYKNLGIIFKT